MYQVVPKKILAYIVIHFKTSLLNLENVPKVAKNEPKNHFGTKNHQKKLLYRCENGYILQFCTKNTKKLPKLTNINV